MTDPRDQAIEARKRIAAVIYYARTRIDLDQASAGTREADAAFHDADALIAAGLLTRNPDNDTLADAWDEGLLVGQDPYGFDTTNNPYRTKGANRV